MYRSDVRSPLAPHATTTNIRQVTSHIDYALLYLSLPFIYETNTDCIFTGSRVYLYVNPTRPITSSVDGRDNEDDVDILS